MRNKVDIMGIPVDRVTMKEALERLGAFLDGDGTRVIYTPNAEIMMDALRDPQLADILRNADMLVPDGAGVVLASKILGRKLPERVPGFDLVKNSFSLCPTRRIRYFLLGGRPGVAEQAAINILKDYPGIEIAGCRHGYFSEEEEKDIIRDINSSRADILLVALGAPKQEKWIHRNRDNLNVKVCIGVGGSLDIFAGKTKLAPEFFRKNGLEWLHRLLREPRRAKRMLKLPLFILRVLFVKISGKEPRRRHLL